MKRLENADLKKPHQNIFDSEYGHHYKVFSNPVYTPEKARKIVNEYKEKNGIPEDPRETNIYLDCHRNDN